MPETPTPGDKIARWVARFEGYETPGARGNSDQAFREYLAEKLDQMFRVVGGAADHFGPSEEASQFRETLRQSGGPLVDLADHVRVVPYAFGEFLTAGDLAEKALGAFYMRDEDILEELSRFHALIEPTVSDATDFASLIKEVGGAVERLTVAIEARQTAISDFIQPPPNRTE
jgi:hypothetical protein